MEKAIAKDLLSIGAVFLRPQEPFIWASGIKDTYENLSKFSMVAIPAP